MNSLDWLVGLLQHLQQLFEILISHEFRSCASNPFISGHKSIEEIVERAQSVQLQQFIAMVEAHADGKVALNHTKQIPLTKKTKLSN